MIPLNLAWKIKNVAPWGSFQFQHTHGLNQRAPSNTVLFQAKGITGELGNTKYAGLDAISTITEEVQLT